MGSMLNNHLYVLFVISLAFSWSRSRVLEKRMFAIGEELPADSFRAHANLEPSALSSEESEISAKLHKSTLEPKVFPPYVEEFIHPSADAWTVPQTVGLLFPDSRQTEFISLWRTDLAGYVTHKSTIQRIHGVGAPLAKEVISISNKRQNLAETLSGFIKDNEKLVKQAFKLFDKVLKKRESSGGAALSTEKIEGGSRADVKFSLRDAFGEQAWKRVSGASENGEQYLKKLMIYEEKNFQPALIKDDLSSEEYGKLTKLVKVLQSAKKDIKTHIDAWKKLMEADPQIGDSTEALQKIKTRVNGLIENYKVDPISEDE